MNTRPLIARLDRHEADLARRPLWVPNNYRPSYVLQIDRGNTLDGTGQLGIKYSTTLVSGIPTYDPNTDTSFVDGLGRGRVVIDGVMKSGYVLIVNDPRNTFGNALLQGDGIWSGGWVPITLAAGGTARAYVAG